jgi:branched-chain amino acid transport system permease protein
MVGYRARFLRRSAGSSAIGAAVFLLMKHFVSSQTDHWLLIVGIIFVACVMFFRGGIYGLIDRIGARRATP